MSFECRPQLAYNGFPPKKELMVGFAIGQQPAVRVLIRIRWWRRPEVRLAARDQKNVLTLAMLGKRP
jgi:hypothetical protein